MKRVTQILAIAAVSSFALAGIANAQSNTGATNARDSMMDEKAKKDAMMKKDTMMKDGEMKKHGEMKADEMKKDSMKKSEMKK